VLTSFRLLRVGLFIEFDDQSLVLDTARYNGWNATWPRAIHLRPRLVPRLARSRHVWSMTTAAVPISAAPIASPTLAVVPSNGPAMLPMRAAVPRPVRLRPCLRHPPPRPRLSPTAAFRPSAAATGSCRPSGRPACVRPCGWRWQLLAAVAATRCRSLRALAAPAC